MRKGLSGYDKLASSVIQKYVCNIRSESQVDVLKWIYLGPTQTH